MSMFAPLPEYLFRPQANATIYISQQRKLLLTLPAIVSRSTWECAFEMKTVVVVVTVDNKHGRRQAEFINM